MPRALPLALLAALPAAAAPLPEAERQRLEVEQRYGTWTDPGGDAAFRVVADGVRIHLSPRRCWGPEYVLPWYAPRFARTVEGDFTATVRVTCPQMPDEWLSGDAAYLAAGLIVRDGGVKNAAILRCEKVLEDGTRVSFGYSYRKADGSGASADRGRPHRPGPAYLRLTRTGAVAAMACSWDGAQWEEYSRVELDWGHVLTVGVIAENLTGRRAEATFDRFTLTRPKN